jgi:hypothetical protein
MVRCNNGVKISVGDWLRKQKSDFCREGIFKPVEDEAESDRLHELHYFYPSLNIISVMK